MTPIVRRSVAGILVAASLVFAAGCGGDSSTKTVTGGGSTTTAALTADAFRQQADAICKDIQTKIDALGTPQTPAELPTFFEKGLALGTEQLTRLKALTPPADMKAAYDDALSLQQQQIDLLTQARDRIGKGENVLTVIQSLSPTMDPLEAKAKQRAAELGLTECGKNGGDSGDTSTTQTTSTTPTGTSTDSTTSGSVVPMTAFVADIDTFVKSLTQFGTTLQAAADGPAALKARSAMLRGQLDDFDAITTKMAGYTVDTPALETKRAAIVEAAPDVSRLGRELLDAAEANDAGKVQSVVGELATALQRLSKSAAK